MTLINRLRREIHDGAMELRIRPQDIGPLAAHVRTIMSWQPSMRLSDAEIRLQIVGGQLKMLGVPVRVMGAVQHYRALVYPNEAMFVAAAAPRSLKEPN